MVVDGFCVEEQQDSAINGLIEELALTAQLMDGFCSTGKQRTACVYQQYPVTTKCTENSCHLLVGTSHSSAVLPVYKLPRKPQHVNVLFRSPRLFSQTFTIFKTFCIQLAFDV